MSNQVPDELIKQFLFDYNMNTSVLGNSEDEEIENFVKSIKALITAEKKKLLEGLSEEAVELWYDGSDINRKLPKPVHAVPTSAVEEEIKKLNQVPSEEPSVDFTQLDPDGVDIDEVIEALPEEPPLEVPSEGKDV